MLYYLSRKVEEVGLRLFVSIGRTAEILEQCHEKMGHMGIDKTYDLMEKTYWPRLYNEVTKYVQNCVVWQAESRKPVSLVETDVPNFPFEKVSMDITGPYGETPKLNLYIIGLVD